MAGGIVKTVVFYHNDLDGFAAAFATWLKLGDDDVEYVEFAHNSDDPVQEEHRGCRLICLDCFLGGIPGDFSADVLVIDHHPETLAAAEGYQCDNYTFYADAKMSAALLAWYYWHGNDDAAAVPPLWAQWVSDYDTWQHKLPMTREFVLAAELMPKDFAWWQRCFDSEDLIQEMIQDGKGMRKMQVEIVHRLAKKFHICQLDGVEVYAVNSSVWPNEICEWLLKEQVCGVAGVYYFDPKRNGWKWSVRSEENTIDAGFLCQKLGGGGHAQAGGFLDSSKIVASYS